MKPAKKLFLRFIPVIIALIMVVWSLPGAFAMIGSAVSTTEDVPAFSKNAGIGESISFKQSDFVSEADSAGFDGIVITSLPDPLAGVLRLGNRDLLTGEAVAVESIGSLKFIPSADTEVQTTFNYLPVFKTGVTVESVTVGINLISGKTTRPLPKTSK